MARTAAQAGTAGLGSAAMTFGDGLAAGVLAGVILACLCGAVGAWAMAVDYTKQIRRERTENRKPMCGCRHHYSFHDDDGCHHRGVHYNETVECGCVCYVGPPPPEIAA